MDLLALADFNLVARHGGFGRAARASLRPKATLSRRVAELEAALNLRLFERSARTLKLTEEGKALHERTGALLAELDETATAIASGGTKPRGRLRISVPLLFSQTAMGKLAGDFTLRFPDVSLEVTAEDRSVDMVEEGYDLAIRVNPALDDSWSAASSFVTGSSSLRVRPCLDPPAKRYLRSSAAARVQRKPGTWSLRPENRK